MARIDKIVTNQVQGRITSDRREPNTYAFDSSGVLIRHDVDSEGKSVVGPGVLFGANKDSSDQSGLNTIKLIPNEDIQSDQYLIIEPTAPNHIHIRAGGTQDESNADLILGGERNNVYIEDDARQVSISTRLRRIQNTYVNINEENNAQFIASMPVNVEVGYTVTDGSINYEVSAVAINTPTEGLVTITATGLNNFVFNNSYTFSYEPPYNNNWEFTSDGYLFGPAMGGLRLTGIEGIPGNPLWFGTNESIILNATNGQYLDSDSPRNQIVTIGTKAIYPRVNVYWSEPIVGTYSHIGTLMYANMDGDNPHFLVPNDESSDIPIGSEIKFATNSTSAWFIDRQDSGTSTLIADGGNGYTGVNDNYPYIVPINSTGTLLKVDANRWILSGPRLTD